MTDPEGDPVSLFDRLRQAGLDGTIVERAWQWANREPRRSGWGSAGLETAEILAELSLDPAMLATALVVDPTGTEEDDREAIAAQVGVEVAEMAGNERRLERIRWDRIEDEAPENLRRMVLALVNDIRVVLVALARRIQRLRHLDQETAAERRRFAHETLEIFAPLANRLGVWQFKWELEDGAFRELHPESYQEIRDHLAETRAARTEHIERLVETLRSELANQGVKAEVYGRPKHIYSIYKKMLRKDVDFAEVYDVSAVRILVDRVQDCYAALGLVHGLWTPIAGEFDDYIAKPKDNFYQSLHTAVLGPEGRPLEIQIRTREMHEFAEHGVAAHWTYKEGKRRADGFEHRIAWLRQLLEWHKEIGDPEEFARSLKSDVFQEQVYVFTPNGDVVDLPEGSTPIDFAYRIHTAIGHGCRGARVNGKIVPLDRHLQTGDRVQILTTKAGTPSRDWLNPHLGYVRTASARQKIRQFFRQQVRETAVAQGRDLVDRELKRLGHEGRRIDDVAAIMGFSKGEDFLSAVGFGDLSVHQVATKLLEADRPQKPPVALAKEPPAKRGASVRTAGIDDVLSHPAKCCRPVPGDAVIGYITRGRGLTIHRQDCPNMRKPSEPERLVALEWEPRAHERHTIAVQVIANDRAGLLRDIAEIVTNEGVQVSSAQVSTDPARGTAVVDATLEVVHHDQALRILSRIERLPYVLSAQRVAG